MPAGSRVRPHNVFGVTTDNPLSAGAVVFNSLGLQNMPAITGSQHTIVTLDPLRQFGNPEIVIVTAHTAAATVATITRGAYGTVARSHPVNTVWVCAPLNEDFIPILTSITRPSDPYRGEALFETDTNRYIGRSTADVWQQLGLFFDPPACRLNNAATAQSHTATGNWQAVTFSTENYDTASMHNPGLNPSRITIPIAGIYLLTTNTSLVGNATGQRGVGFRVNGTGTGGPTLSMTSDAAPSAGNITHMHYADQMLLAANDYVEVVVFQNSGGNLAYDVNQAEGRPNFGACWIGRGN